MKTEHIQVNALLAADPDGQRPRAPAARGLYTYLIRPLGPVSTVGSAEHPVELVMRASMVRRDGSDRRHVLRVRPTERQPHLVDRVSELLRRNVPIRMVVRFESAPSSIVDGMPSMRVQAIAESLLEPETARNGTQLDLFA